MKIYQLTQEEQKLFLDAIQAFKSRIDLQWDNGNGNKNKTSWADLRDLLVPITEKLNLTLICSTGSGKLPYAEDEFCSMCFFRKDLNPQIYPAEVQFGFYIWLGYYFKTLEFELRFGRGGKYNPLIDQTKGIKELENKKLQYYYKNYDELTKSFSSDFLSLVEAMNSQNVLDFEIPNSANTISEKTLGLELKIAYDNAELKEKVNSILMFGIVKHNIISDYKLSPDKIIKESGLGDSYATELRKGMKIGKKLLDMQLLNTNLSIQHSKNDLVISTPLNQIFYGSPGTGKTYHTIDKALEILASFDEKLQLPSQDNRSARKELFEIYKQRKQIEFVTFHQNYGYEEFVEGIKPIPNDNGSVSYKVTQGIFKRLCEVAEQNYKEANPDKYKDELKLENLVDAYLDSIREKLEQENSDGEKIGDEIRILKINSNNGLVMKKKNVKDTQTISTAKGSILYRDYPNFFHGKITRKEEIKPAESSKNKQHGNAEYYYAFYNALKKFSDTKKISQDSIPESKPLKPYILIIDEINRGNISKIFGELITLIEPSKRIGADEELRVTLPYSGSQAEDDETKGLFGVPSNLYIIGTMNTADRSITSLDTALRRRFEFVEMMPDATKLEKLEVHDKNGKTDIKLDNLLRAINDRIEFLYDREKTIGHAFFLSEDKDHKGNITLEQLKGIFQNKIIPLLQEYFYNDYEAIQAVLNDNGMIEINVDSNKQEKSKYIFKGAFKDFINDRGLDEKKIFKIAPKDQKNIWDEPNTYKKIYGEGNNNEAIPTNSTEQ